MHKNPSPNCGSPRARAIRTIREWIQAGSLRPGDVLPTEQELCERLGIARGTVRAALAEIEKAGLATRRKGCRRVVSAHMPAASSTMRRTIALISGLEEPVENWQTFPGRLQAIEGSALVAMQREGYHGLTVHPESLAAGGLKHLCLDRPYGVLIPDPFAARPEALEAAKLLRQAGIPVVLNADGPDLARFDRVVSDQATGTRDLTRALVVRGCRRILRLWIADHKHYWLMARNRGFEEAVREAGLELLPPIHIAGMPDNRAGAPDLFQRRVRLMAGYLVEILSGPDRPDALMLTSDAEVAPAAAACRLFGLIPNRDITLVGYDNMCHRWPEYEIEPTLPVLTVDKKNVRIGASLVELLLQRAAQALPAEPQCRLITPEVVAPEYPADSRVFGGKPDLTVPSNL